MTLNRCYVFMWYNYIYKELYLLTGTISHWQVGQYPNRNDGSKFISTASQDTNCETMVAGCWLGCCVRLRPGWPTKDPWNVSRICSATHLEKRWNNAFVGSVDVCGNFSFRLILSIDVGETWTACWHPSGSGITMIRQDSREGGIASNEQHKCIFLLLNLQVLYDCILWFHGKTQLRKIPDFIYRRYEWRVQLCTDQVYPEFIVVYERIFFHERFQAFWLQMTPSLKSVCYWKKAWFLQITSDFRWISSYFHATELPDLRACCIHGMWYAMHVASFCYPCCFHMNIYIYIYVYIYIIIYIYILAEIHMTRMPSQSDNFIIHRQ